MDPRLRVAREAARLLHTGASEGYKQAKEMAARSLGVDVMPSNYEVAIELDLMAERLGGEERKQLLIAMRNAALTVMRALAEYSPVLIGSVWRGTARKGSDVDVTVYAVQPEDVRHTLALAGCEVEKSEGAVAIKGGQAVRSEHITVRIDDGIQAEIVVRPPEEKDKMVRCEIYGDLKRGLNITELERLMKTDPLRKFVPRRRYR